jgi:phage tail tape-measure protein
MALSANQLEILISARDKATAVIKSVSRSIKSLGKVTKSFGTGFKNIFSKLTGAIFNLRTGILTLAGSYGIGSLAKSIVDVGMEFETYEATLKTVLGSQEKANEAFKWLQEFAKKTPYSINDLTNSFVKLAAYGIKGQDVMATLGDTASALGKDINMAVEALADAQTGEFERLKEFGIKAIQITKSNAKKMGASLEQVGQTALAFTDKMGKETYKIIDRNNREMITSTLMAIWNDKYAGAMEERSKTLAGMFSNLGDLWTEFRAKIADRVIPHLELRVSQFMEAWNKYFNQSGQAAENWQKIIGDVFNNAIDYVSGFLGAFMQTMATSSSGYDGNIRDQEAWVKAGQESFGTLKQSLIDINNTFKELNFSLKDISGTLNSITTFFSNMAGAVRAAVRALERYKKILGDIGRSAGVGLGMSMTGPDAEAAANAAPATAGLRAAGGPVRGGGSYLVGERGPEIFTPNKSGTISNKTGGGTTVINNIYTSNSRHGVDNALASRGDMSIRSSRIGLNLAGI